MGRVISRDRGLRGVGARGVREAARAGPRIVRRFDPDEPAGLLRRAVQCLQLRHHIVQQHWEVLPVRLRSRYPPKNPTKRLSQLNGRENSIACNIGDLQPATFEARENPAFAVSQ